MRTESVAGSILKEKKKTPFIYEAVKLLEFGDIGCSLFS